MVFYECRLKSVRSVRWDDVTIVEHEDSSGGGGNDDVFFTESHSPSESIMERSVHIEVRRPSRSSNNGAPGQRRSRSSR